MATFFLLCLIAGTAYAKASDNILHLVPEVDSYNPVPYLYYMEDPDGGLSLSEAAGPEMAGRYRPLPGRSANLGVTRSTFWFRLLISNRFASTQEGRYVFSLNQAYLTWARVYIAETVEATPGQFREVTPRTRTDRPAHGLSRFIHFELPIDKQLAVYLQVRAPIALELRPILSTQAAYKRQLFIWELIFGAYLGALLGLACYHLVVFFSLKDISYLWYVLTAAMAIVYFTTMNGTMQELAPQGADWVNAELPIMALCLVFLFRILFAKNFLSLPGRMPWANRLVNALAVVMVPLTIAAAIPDTRALVAKITIALGFVVPIWVVCLGWVSWRSGFGPARYFVAAYGFNCLTILFFIAALLGGLPLGIPLHNVHQAGISMEAVLLAMGLGNRIKTLRREREALRLAAEKERQAYQKQLSGLVWEMERLEENEKRKIAEGLHDTVTQDISSALWRLRLLDVDSDAASAQREKEEVEATLDKALRDLRALSFEISPPELYDYGLGSAIQTLGENLEDRHAVAVDFRIMEKFPRLSEEMEIILFRIARELIINVVKHAGASQVCLSLIIQGGEVRLSVEDDGVGFQTETGGQLRKGYGLFSIGERLKNIGGGIVIESGDGKGSLVLAHAPVDAGKEARGRAMA